MRIKVCGLTRVQDVKLACELRAWAVGFVFAPSPRQVTRDQARKLRDEVIPGTKVVGVFADASREEVLLVLRDCPLDALQFHGRETPEECEGYPVPVWKALTLNGAEELPLIRTYKTVERVLLEPKRTLADRKAGRLPPIGEQRACWQLAYRARASSVVLAGGLNPDNVREAVQLGKPFAVDVSSGIESAAGIKDERKMKAFFEALM